MIADFLSILSTNLFIFLFLWALFLLADKIAWVDFFWAASIGCWSLVHLLDIYQFRCASQCSSIAVIVPLITLGWSLRLSYHLALRLLKSKGQDRRYESIKSASKKSWGRKSALIFLMNAVLVSVLVLPQRLLILGSQQVEMNLLEIFGIVVCLVAILGESIADLQLKKFLALHSQKTLQSGLWKYSRHPNYFFEWLFWLGICLCALPSEDGKWSLLAPLLMFVFLNYLTGVKISETLAEQRRPDFAEYKEKTSAFFPTFPRRK